MHNVFSSLLHKNHLTNFYGGFSKDRLLKKVGPKLYFLQQPYGCDNANTKYKTSFFLKG